MYISSAIASTPLRSKKPTIISLWNFLVFLVVIWEADGATFFSSSVSLDVIGLFSSVWRAEKQFYKGTSGFGAILSLAGLSLFKLPFFCIFALPSFYMCQWGRFSLFKKFIGIKKWTFWGIEMMHHQKRTIKILTKSLNFYDLGT